MRVIRKSSGRLKSKRPCLLLNIPSPDLLNPLAARGQTSHPWLRGTHVRVSAASTSLARIRLVLLRSSGLGRPQRCPGIHPVVLNAGVLLLYSALPAMRINSIPADSVRSSAYVINQKHGH